MPGKSSQQRAALARLNTQLLTRFEQAGFDFITPGIIQPADVFLERAGEDIRQRTYVFTDPDGKELCLRPDLTVPTCRYHLENAKSPDSKQRYCYSGPAFRHQSGRTKAREFDQAGLEIFGEPNRAAADAEILNLTIAALEAAGLEDYTVRLGDLGLFHALLESIGMPRRWRRRLAHHFWRPVAFHQLLDLLTGARPRRQTSISPLVERIEAAGPDAAAEIVEDVLDERGLGLVPGRNIEQIAARLAEKAADRSQKRLDGSQAGLINRYLEIHGSLREVHGALYALAGDLDDDSFTGAIAALEERCKLFDLEQMKNGEAFFSAEFGRSLEYYTGFVFQIEVADKGAEPLVIAGGGRYDNMISDIGGGEPVPAVGCAIHTERLLAATGGMA